MPDRYRLKLCRRARSLFHYRMTREPLEQRRRRPPCSRQPERIRGLIPGIQVRRISSSDGHVGRPESMRSTSNTRASASKIGVSPPTLNDSTAAAIRPWIKLRESSDQGAGENRPAYSKILLPSWGPPGGER